jgi:hypothetical protein
MCDFMLLKDNRYRYFVLDEEMEVSYEVKSGSRDSRGPLSLLDEAVDQCMSHMSKS